MAELTINIKKSKFCVHEVSYFGHLIGRGVSQTGLDKISVLIDFHIPRSIRQLRRFLGMTGWFTTVTAPLTDLLKNKRRFFWNDNAQKAFENLKLILSTAPVFYSPDFSKPLSIHCDASNTGIGEVVVQKTEEGEKFPVTIMSKTFNQAQRKYSATEQLCFAAILSIKNLKLAKKDMN